jgi:hypothetical protein
MLPDYILTYIRQNHRPLIEWTPRVEPVLTVEAVINIAKPQKNRKNGPPVDKEEALSLALAQKGLAHPYRRHAKRRQPGTCCCNCGARTGRKKHFVPGHNQFNGEQFRGVA